VTSIRAREGLPPPHDGVDKQRVKLEAIAASPGSFRGDDGSATAKKAIEHDIVPRAAVHERVSD